MNPAKKQNLIYVGIALGTLVIAMIFTQLDLGKYFRGFIATDLKIPVEVDEFVVGTTGKTNSPTENISAPPTLAPLVKIDETTPIEDPLPEATLVSQPPTLTPIIEEEDNDNDPKFSDLETITTGDAKLKNVDAFPKGFNPQLNATKISYSVTGKGKVDIKIQNTNGVTVATLINNKDVEKGDYHIWWDGTENNKSGKLLSPGTYTYKVTLKDPKDDDVLDTASGSLNLVYAKVASSDETPDNGTIKATNLKSSTSNSQAVVSLQNAQSGKTAGTGPETLIYLIFPAVGYIISRK